MKIVIHMAAVLAALALVGCHEPQPASQPTAGTAAFPHKRDVVRQDMTQNRSFPEVVHVPSTTTTPATAPEIAEVTPAPPEPTVAVAPYAIESKDQFVAATEQRLRDLNQQISDFGEQIESF